MTDAVRDPFGLEPLFYHPPSQRTSPRLDELLPYSNEHPHDHALLEYVMCGSVWAETATFVDDIRRIPPGHALIGGRVERVWSPPEPTIVDRPAHIVVQEFWRVFGDAVERACHGAREVTVPLSGGLDSAAILVALVERLGRERVHAVTRGAPGDEETQCARATAHALGVEQTMTVWDTTLCDWPQFPYWPATPRTTANIDWERATSRDGVVMWGLGGDSLQRGDRRHYALRLQRGEVARAVGDIVRTVLLHGRKPALGLRRALTGARQPLPVPPWVAPRAAAEAARIARRRVAQLEAANRRGVDEMFAPIWAYHFDWMSAAHNDPPLRHVFPFFDVELLHFFATVPTAPWCVDKELLRATLRGAIPDEVRLRPKSLVVKMPKVDVTEAWSRRLRDETSRGDENIVNVEYVTAKLQPGPHDEGELLPLLRCAATQRWRASRLTAVAASSTLSASGDGVS